MDKYNLTRNLIILSSFILLCSMQCGYPYEAKIKCVDGKVNCKTIPFENSLELTAENTWIINIRKKLNVYIHCNLKNQGNTQEILDRNRFSLVSYRGLTFNLEKMQKENKNGKIVTLPNIYTVKTGSDEVYGFLFSSVTIFTNQEMINELKRDSFLFIHNLKTADTLFKIIATDKRIK
jgi:hypothetical protein